MMKYSQSSTQSLSEEQLSDVLARAAAIDAKQGVSILAADVESIAREAGISASAVQQALAELQSPLLISAIPSGPRRLWRRIQDALTKWEAHLRVAEHALLGGVLTGALSEPGSAEGAAAIIGVGAIAVVTVIRAFHHRSRGSWLRLQFELVQLWAGFCAGLYLGGTAIEAEPARMLFVYWLGASMIGGLLSVPKAAPVQQHTKTDASDQFVSVSQTAISRSVV